MSARSTILLALAALAGPGVLASADDLQDRIRALIDTLGTRDVETGIDGLVAIGAPAVPSLVAAANAGGRGGGAACEALARIGTPGALDAVHEAAKARDVSVRRGALGALGRVPSERSVQVLAEAVRTDPDGRARQAAAGALGRIGSKAAVAPLLSALGDEWQWVRVEAVAALAGEIQPHYVQWYGFYEGHTEWRVDPVAIALVFGLRTLAEIEAAFPGRLDEVLTAHFTRRTGP